MAQGFEVARASWDTFVSQSCNLFPQERGKGVLSFWVRSNCNCKGNGREGMPITVNIFNSLAKLYISSVPLAVE
ncbi:hypothetical protein Sjap_002132 [Stephania japonica]|uniref:Uncharacterized protein n=1 Tax=Stephania japonica TaxID=461633 RepID=A0AAP0KNI9_9MAGN